MGRLTLPASLFDGFRLACLEKHLHLRQIHVYLEGYEPLMHAFLEPTRENIYSGSKTFTSAAVGMAVDEGLFSLEDHVLDFFPEMRAIASPGMEKIRLVDLLHMRSGKGRSLFHYPEDPAEHPDYLEDFFRRPLKHEVNTVFRYCNYNSYLLGRTIEKVSGQNLRDYLDERLFQPLRIANVHWNLCPCGHPLAATGLYLKTEEFARFARLLLQEGVWQDKYLLSADYIRAMHEDLVPTAEDFEEEECQQGYGYQVWKCTHKNSWRADGLYGQFALIYPDERAAITLTAREELAPYEIIACVNREILPRLS